MLNSAIRFEDILGDCITAIQERGETVEGCLTRYSEQQEGLEPLLRLVIRLQAARALTAPPGFHRAAVTRMNNLIAARPHRATPTVVPSSPLHSMRPKLRPVFRPQTRFSLAVVISVCTVIVLLAVSGAVYASAAALPGDTLYVVKTTVENVELALSPNDFSHAKLHLAFATWRLGEAAALSQENRSRDLERALAGYTIQLESVQALFDKSSHLSPDEQIALLNLLVTDLSHHKVQLTTLLERAPEGARPTLEATLRASQAQHDWALEVLGGKPGEGTLEPTPTPTPVATATPPPETPTPAPSPRSLAPTELPESSDWRPPKWQTPESTAWATPPRWPTGRPTLSWWRTAWPTGWPTPPQWPTTWPTGWPTPSGKWSTPMLPDWPKPPQPPDWPKPPLPPVP